MRFIPQNPMIKAVSLLTLVLGLAPLLIYYCARLWFHLPSEAQWERNGGNGSPWGNEPLSFLFIFAPFLLLVFLPIVTLIGSIASAVKGKRVSVAVQGIAICAVQWGLAYLQFVVVFWAIE